METVGEHQQLQRRASRTTMTPRGARRSMSPGSIDASGPAFRRSWSEGLPRNRPATASQSLTASLLHSVIEERGRSKDPPEQRRVASLPASRRKRSLVKNAMKRCVDLAARGLCLMSNGVGSWRSACVEDPEAHRRKADQVRRQYLRKLGFVGGPGVVGAQETLGSAAPRRSRAHTSAAGSSSAFPGDASEDAFSRSPSPRSSPRSVCSARGSSKSSIAASPPREESSFFLQGGNVFAEAGEFFLEEMSDGNTTSRHRQQSVQTAHSLAGDASPKSMASSVTFASSVWPTPANSPRASSDGDEASVLAQGSADARVKYLGKLSYQKVWLPPVRQPPRQQTIIVFDWDDTLFPTSFVRKYPEQIEGRASRVRALCRASVRLLEASQKYGKTFIITNGTMDWVEDCVRYHVPAMAEVLKGVRVISARDMYEQRCPDFYQWKAHAFKLLRQHVDPASVANLIVLGDSELEMEAGKAISRHFPQVALKLLKFSDEPALEELIRELVLVRRVLRAVVQGGLNMTMSFSKKKTPCKSKRVSHEDRSLRKRDGMHRGTDARCGPPRINESQACFDLWPGQDSSMAAAKTSRLGSGMSSRFVSSRSQALEQRKPTRRLRRCSSADAVPLTRRAGPGGA
eukprot:TRINITY_DN101832_c0_g1_i1.p1 TRINITY_DN101832_c0_g1~~TRINITY_DN101832_c0_g1_i1.p1  ORF type:complete len:630 (-),score=98.68 TRINITY_DN101832_c0_g1_i1:267-2156(-)